jgi:hypothetical protein
MSVRMAVIRSLSLSAALCAGCGTSSAPLDRSESSSPDAGNGASSSGGATLDGATSDLDASSTGSMGPEPAADGAADDAGADGSRPSADAAAGDAGLIPYKGVANSPCADLVTLGVTWWYNWTLSPSGCTVPEFAPMIWGHTGKEQTASGVAGEIAGIVSGGYKNVLGFNEPDNTGQSNMSVATAIALWPSFNDPSLRLGSPATQGNGTGLTWIQDFMSQVAADTTGKLRVDFIATHWYGWNAGSCDAKAANLESWIKQIEAIPGNRPIWLTEWGCLNDSNPDAKTVQAFFSGAIAMFANHPRVARYAWYPWTTNNELFDGGALTSLGTVFAGAPPSM